MTFKTVASTAKSIVDITDAYSVFLSNEAVVIACDASGAAVSGQLGASGVTVSTISAYKGAIKLSAVAAGSTPVVEQFNYVLGTPVGCTVQRKDDSTFYLSAISADGGNVPITIYLENGTTTITKTFTFGKTKTGATGQATYTWIKYADDANGAGMNDSPNNKTYIGIANNKTTSTESTVATDYAWSLIQGARGPEAEEPNLINRNPHFYDWTSTYPAYYTNGAGSAPAKIASNNKSGNAVQYTVAAAQEMYMNQTSNGKPFYEYVYLEATFRLDSGTLDGAGVLFRVEATADIDYKFSFKSSVPSPVLGKWYTVSIIYNLPSVAPAGFTGYTVWPMAGWSGIEAVTAKTISIDSVKARPATEAEIYGYNTGTVVDAWKGAAVNGVTRFNGGLIETNTITAQHIAIADYTNLAQIDAENNPNGHPTVDISNLKYFMIGQEAYSKLQFATAKTQEFKVGDEYYIAGNGYKEAAIGTVTAIIRYIYTDGSLANAASATVPFGSTAATFALNLQITTDLDPLKTLSLIEFIFEKDSTTTGYYYARQLEFRKRYTGELIVDGTLTFDKSRGGELILGGQNDEYGRFIVLDNAGETIADLNAAEGGFDKLYVGDLQSPSVMRRSDVDVTWYVNPSTGDDENPGTSAAALKSISRALELIPPYITGTYTIEVQGSSTEEVLIYGFMGIGSIRINMNNYTVTGNFKVNSVLCYLAVYDGIINNSTEETYATIFVGRSMYTFFQNCTVYSRGIASNSLVVADHAYAYFYLCKFYNSVNDAIRVGYMGQCLINGCEGKSNGQYGLFAQMGGQISGTGTAPSGPTGTYRVATGGTVGTFTYPAYTPPAPPPAPNIVKTWSSISGETYRSSVYVGWRNDNDVRQGQWSGNGQSWGFWFFGTGPTTTVAGKSIKKIRFYATRNSAGGNSGPVSVTFRSHGHASQPAGAPAVGSSTYTVTFKWGESKWITLPSSFYPDFTTQGATGIAIYTSSTSNGYYAIMNDTAKLEVTYA